MRTIKPYKAIETTPKELFENVVELSSKEIKILKDKLTKEARNEKCSISFVESDGITLYVYDLSMDDDNIKVLNTITSKVKKSSNSWKFGFMNNTSGKILLLFGGHTVADRESAIDVFKIACSIVKERFQPKVTEELIPFSIQK